MKVLNGINNKLKAPNIRENPDIIPTFKDVIIDSLKFSRTKDGSESIKVNRLADKIFDFSVDTDALEDAEFTLMKEKCNLNQAGYLAWAHGQVMEKILEWEKGSTT